MFYSDETARYYVKKITTMSSPTMVTLFISVHAKSVIFEIIGNYVQRLRLTMSRVCKDFKAMAFYCDTWELIIFLTCLKLKFSAFIRN